MTSRRCASSSASRGSTCSANPYGAYLMTVYAQRHPASVRSIVLSSGFPLDFDMWGRPTAEAVRLAVRRVCARSTTGR
jgi:pimeloyl-ACP methyl ester carboxylesterase